MSFVIDFRGKVALITGVSSGIGAGVARQFAKAGAHVAGCARKPETDESVRRFRNSVEAEGVCSLYVETDVVKIEDLENLVRRTVERFGRIDFLVSNAGVNVFEGAEGTSEETWRYNTDLNLSSHWRLAKLCKPHLEKTGGVILIMTSNHAFSTIPGCFPYNVTKTALKGLVRSLAIEWGPKIRTVGVAPGFICTPGNDKWFSSFEDADSEHRRTVELHPVKRLGTVEEVGALCVFLASPDAGFISGTTVLMDGGRSALMQDS